MRKEPLWVIVNCISFIISVFFIYTGIFKLINPESFILNISKTGFFNEKLIPYLPYIIGFFELIIAVLILTRMFIGQLFFTITMIVFSFYITYLNNNNLYEVCGCGGILNGLSYNNHLLINLIFLTLSFSVIFILKSSKFTRKN